MNKNYTHYIKTGFEIFAKIFSRKYQLKLIKNKIYTKNAQNSLIFDDIYNYSLLKNIFDFYKDSKSIKQSMMVFLLCKNIFFVIIFSCLFLITFVTIITIEIFQKNNFFSAFYYSLFMFVFFYFAAYFILRVAVVDLIKVEITEELEFSDLIFNNMKKIYSNEEKKEIIKNINLKNEEKPPKRL